MLLKFFLFSFVDSRRFPGYSNGFWISSPSIHDPTELRATETSILLAWSHAVHSIEPIDSFELQARYPTEISPYESLYLPIPTEDGFYPTSRIINREWSKSWSNWEPVYVGLGRQFRFDTSQFSGLENQRVWDFRVRAKTVTGSYSSWSSIVPAHAILARDRFNMEIFGSGKNSAGISEIKVDGQSLWRRRDKQGLTLAIFDRRDFSLVSLETFNTFNSSTESARMATAIRACGPDFVIAVVSSYAWEWHFTPVLASAMEDYGAYYVGQWSRIFDSTSLQSSPFADLAETSSADSFGHPYAFVGMYGLGMGNGWESLQLNTGHYRTTGKSERAIIRLSFYFNYMFGKFLVGSQSTAQSHDLFVKSQRPRPGTVHAPITRVKTWNYAIQPVKEYAPYIGNLHNQIEFLMEANETVVISEYNATNFGFEIVQETAAGPIVTVDPRQSNVLTELEAVWGGPSTRYNIDGSVLANPVGTERVCADILENRFSPGTDCDEYDYMGGVVPVLLQYGIGLWPGTCDRDGCGVEVPVGDFSITTKTVRSDAVNVLTDIWP